MSQIWQKTNNFSGVLTEFFFSYTNFHTKVKEPSLSYYLPITGETIVWFIPFPRVLKRCKMRMLYSYLHVHSASQRHNIKDRRMNKRRMIKTHEGRKTQEDFFRKIFTSHFFAKVRKGCWRVACERVLETEHKLHILTSTAYDRHVVSFLFS